MTARASLALSALLVTLCLGPPVPGRSAEPGEVQLHSRGWLFTEGPVLDDDGTAWWVDARRHRILRQRPGGEVETIPVRTRGPAGLAWATDGRLLVTEFGGRKLTAVDPDDGNAEVLTERFDGRRFNSPNDLVVDAQGTIWFTDPAFLVAPSQRDQNVFRFTADGELTAAAGDLRGPNGIALSPDGRHLVVAEFWGNRLTRFEVTDAGELVARTEIARTPMPDGLCVDDRGALYVASRGDILGFDIAGTPLGRLRVPGDTTNCAIRGDRMLITAKTRVFEVALPLFQD
jgi:gluconolactonase